MVPSVTSVAVIVQLPVEFRVTVKVAVPDASAASAGNVAVPSVLVMLTVSVEATTFHTASTALTVMLNGTPDDCTVGVPVLPETVFGAAVSPGSNTCNLVNGRLIMRKYAALPVGTVTCPLPPA